MGGVKAGFSIIFIIFVTISLSGCWDYHESEDLAIISGVAIDKGTGENKYLITAEIPSPKGLAKDSNITSELVKSEGKTILDAARNIVKVTGKKTYWSHMDIIIVSQEVAKDGLLPVVDFFTRQIEPRLTIRILVSKEKTAGELLLPQNNITKISSIKMMETLKSEEKLVSKIPKTDMRDLANTLSGQGLSPVLPTVKIASSGKKQTTDLSGSAVFRHDKLVGFLDEEDTKFFLFVRDRIKETILVLEQTEDTPKNGISIELVKSEIKRKPVVINSQLVMNIDVRTMGVLSEAATSKNIIDEQGRKKLANDIETTLKSGIINVINKVQVEYGTDIFGFGDIIKYEMPAFWKANSHNWDEMFRSLDCRVTVDAKLQRSGLLFKPIGEGD